VGAYGANERKGKGNIGHILFDAPDPRSIASLPVDWIASTMAEGGATGRRKLISAP